MAVYRSAMHMGAVIPMFPALPLRQSSFLLRAIHLQLALRQRVLLKNGIT